MVNKYQPCFLQNVLQRIVCDTVSEAFTHNIAARISERCSQRDCGRMEESFQSHHSASGLSVHVRQFGSSGMK